MSYNIVENGQLKSITSSGMVIEGKPIYGPRKIYATNKVLPKSGESPLTYTINEDGVLTGSAHKIGNGYSAFLMLNDQALDNLDNYGTESGTFSFPNIRVNVGDVIKITTNVPATENTNVFMLNIIGVIPIVGMEPGGEIEVEGTMKYENTPIADCNLAPINTVCEWDSNTLNTPFKQGTGGGYALGQVQTVNNGSSQYFTQIATTIGGGRSFIRFKKPDQDWTVWVETTNFYSTSETVVGVWIDGKPIYRKVITYTGSVGVKTKIDSTLTYSYIDSIVSYNIIGLDSSNSTNAIIPIPTASANSSSGTSSCDWWIQSDGFYVGVGNNRTTTKITAIFEYTKK